MSEKRKTPEKPSKTLESEISRFNMHQASDDSSARDTAHRIEAALAEEERRNNKSNKNTSKPKFELAETKKTTNSAVTTQLIQIGRDSIRQTEEIIPLPPRQDKYLYTSSKDPQILVNRLKAKKEEEEKKRHSEKLSTTTDEQKSKRQCIRFASFEGSISTYEDLFDKSRRYFVSQAKRNPKVEFSRIPRNVSKFHIANILWQPYHPELTECCSKRIGICQSMIGKLKHPLKPDVSCMAYLTELQYEAFVKNERVSPLESDSEQYYRSSLCVLCYRYNISRIIADDSKMPGSSITTEIADYYHLTGIEGEYRQDVCFQNQGGLLRGVNGNIVMFQPNTFMPVVGLISESNPRKIERVLDLVDYETEKHDLTERKLAYGWREHGVFVKLNNNTVPESSEINPYVTSYTHLADGPLSARLILEGYFASRSDVSGFWIFKEFDWLVSNYTAIWKAAHPMTESSRLKQYEQNRQFLDESSDNPWERYHVWEHACLHSITQPPDRRECKVYYVFLYIINGLIQVMTKQTSFPENIVKKMKRYVSSFGKFQDYFKSCGDDFSDKRLEQTRVVDRELELNCSARFSCYPRIKKLGFVVHEYRYLTFERVVLKRLAPDQELRKLYATSPDAIHSEEVLNRESKVKHLLGNLRKLTAGAYHNLTVFYNNIVIALREPQRLFDWCAKHQLQWPKNLLVHPKKTESNRRSELEKVAESMADTMDRILRRVFIQLQRENEEYTKMKKLLHYALDPFDAVQKRIDVRVKLGTSGIRTIFEMVGCQDFSYLLPDNYIATEFGINFIPWKENTILLTLLLRVHICERLIVLECNTETQKRHLLTLLRNSHVPLVNVITELPASVPFKRNNQWLRYMSIMPQGGYLSKDPTNYTPSLSYYDAYTPYSDLVFHEGRLPNLTSATTQLNYFFDGASDTFTSFLHPVFKHKSSISPCVGKQMKNIFSNDPVKHCAKPITRLSRKKNIPEVIDTVNFGSIIPKRFFVLQLMKCSFLGLYEHALVKPSFKITTQLLSLFDNGDTQDVRELFDEFTTKFMSAQSSDGKVKKFKFEKIMNDVIMEYIYLLHRGTAIQHVALQQYGVDLAQKSVFMMDFVRLGIAGGSLSLFTLDELRRKSPIKLSTKIINTACMSTVDRICKVILTSDEPRYDSVNKKHAHIPHQYQVQLEDMINIHAFIDKLSPTSTIYAEDLRAILLTPRTIDALGRINAIVSRSTYDIADAVSIFEELDIHQSSILAYFFNTLQEYLRYGELISRDKDFVESQEKVLKKFAGIPKDQQEYELPKAIHHTAFCISCNTWNGMTSSSQYFMKEYASGPQMHYLMPHGTQAAAFDMIAGGLTCKVKRKAVKKKKGNARDIKPAQPVTEESKFFSVRQKYIEKSKAEGTEPKRLNTIRGMERRKPNCGEIPLMIVNLKGGRIITSKEKVRHPYGKRKTAQYNEKINSMTNDPVSLHPPLKPRPLMMSNPPYTISPCCGSIRTTGPQCWGVNGYYCGACLPRSNIELAIVGEILCTSCRQVLSNSGGNRCPIESCPSNTILPPYTKVEKSQISCTHGVSPVYVVDDFAGRPQQAYFCESCYRDFEHSEPGFVPISAVPGKNSYFIMGLVEGREFTVNTKKKPTME